jgi:hypothetical protein
MTTSKNFSTIIFFILLSLKGNCQFEEGKYLYYNLSDDLGSEILLDSTDTITTVLKGKTLIYHLTKDSLKVNFENDKGMIVYGQYLITHHTFQNVLKIMNVDTGNFDLVIDSYKYPIKTGNWLFYDRNKNLVKIEIYENGFLQEP